MYSSRVSETIVITILVSIGRIIGVKVQLTFPRIGMLESPKIGVSVNAPAQGEVIEHDVVAVFDRDAFKTRSIRLISSPRRMRKYRAMT